MSKQLFTEETVLSMGLLQKIIRWNIQRKESLQYIIQRLTDGFARKLSNELSKETKKDQMKNYFLLTSVNQKYGRS